MVTNGDDLKVSFLKNGETVVTNVTRDHRVVVGKSEKGGRSAFSPPGYWTLTSYANKESGPLYAYYGLRRLDLEPFAIGIYHKMLYEGRVQYNYIP